MEDQEEKDEEEYVEEIDEDYEEVLEYDEEEVIDEADEAVEEYEEVLDEVSVVLNSSICFSCNTGLISPCLSFRCARRNTKRRKRSWTKHT